MEKKTKTPDEIKKGLEICKQGGNWYDTCGKGCPYADDEECAKALPADALEHIQQLEAKAPKWISVEERLPDDGQPVIVYAKHTDKWGGDWHAVMEDCWCGDNGWDVNADTDIHEVTHWMPLPEPPTEVIAHIS